jgi:hypothetical protein
MNQAVVCQHQQISIIFVPVVHAPRFRVCSARVRSFGDWKVNAQFRYSVKDESFADFAIGPVRRDAYKFDG